MDTNLPATFDFTFTLLGTSQLDFPDHFIDFLYHECTDALIVESLQKVGLTQPLPVRQIAPSRYQLLAGYPYLPAIRNLGIDEVYCQLVSPATPLFNITYLQIVHSLSTVRNSPVLQAHLLQEAQQILADHEVMKLLSAMGHKPQRYKLQELLGVLQLESLVVFALHNGTLSLKVGKQFARLSEGDQRYLMKLIDTYRPGGSKQQKLVEMIIEISLREGKSVSDLAEEWFRTEKEIDQDNIPQQLQQLLRYLDHRSSPGKNAAEKKFRQLIQELQPPDRITIEHCLSFEDESLEVRLQFPDSDSLRRQWPAIINCTTP